MTGYQKYLLDLATAGDGAASQELFESISDGLIDNRPLSAVRAGLSAGEYREMVG